MRSPQEILFRLHQETGNVLTWLRPPRLAQVRVPAPFDVFAAPGSVADRLTGTPLAQELKTLADEVLAHRIPLFGQFIATGPEIRWRRDYRSGMETEVTYFRRIPYLDPQRAGDHKIVWELNRHQHLVVLAQAWLLHGRKEYLAEIVRQLEGWWEQNPYNQGMNWASALEVAFRSLSWIWILHLAGRDLPEAVTCRLLQELYRHGVHLELNLSIYFSPNTHLLGEAVALHALGVLFPNWPRSARWRRLGGDQVAEQMVRQVRPDGSHFEQSSAYHVYAVDFFLFHALLEKVPASYWDRLSRMADYLSALTDEHHRIPLMGDDDGGRLFHPYGDQRRFAAATLATLNPVLKRGDLPSAPADRAVQAAWWLPDALWKQDPGPGKLPGTPVLFPDAGVAVLSRTPVHVLVDTRGFGVGGAGHSHAHALQVVCRMNSQDVLLDPGTYTYLGDPAWRDRFRGTAAHNTIQIDGLDQASPSGPFRWLELPGTAIEEWRAEAEFTYLRAACRYRGFRHVRHLVWHPAAASLAILDEVTGPAGVHTVDQIWHGAAISPGGEPGLFRLAGDALLWIAGAENTRMSIESGGDTMGWQSPIPGQRSSAPMLRVSRRGSLPAAMAAWVCLGQLPAGDFSYHRDASRIALQGPPGRVSFRLEEGGWRYPAPSR